MLSSIYESEEAADYIKNNFEAAFVKCWIHGATPVQCGVDTCGNLEQWKFLGRIFPLSDITLNMTYAKNNRFYKRVFEADLLTDNAKEMAVYFEELQFYEKD